MQYLRMLVHRSSCGKDLALQPKIGRNPSIHKKKKKKKTERRSKNAHNNLLGFVNG